MRSPLSPSFRFIAACAFLAMAAPASANDVQWSVTVGSQPQAAPPAVVYAPAQPVYVQPAPRVVYVQPAPHVVYVPQPVHHHSMTVVEVGRHGHRGHGWHKKHGRQHKHWDHAGGHHGYHGSPRYHY